MAVHAVTSRAMYSRRDPWVNMLRATTAALGAGVGGADAVTVLPFDDAIGVTDGFGRRTARNTQLLLLEESHLAKVVDPAAGSWFIESLTNRLAAAAWTVLQDVESRGGIAVALADGSLAAAAEGAWNERRGRLSTRRDPLTGVSEFPLLDESELERAQRPADAGLPVRRLSEPFEELRDAADRATAKVGSRPAVFVAALGDLAAHTARSTWITNFLAVGGVAAVGAEADGSQSPLEAEARFSASGSSVAVICSSDAVYGERAAATATALKEAGARKVVVAGSPGDLRAELGAAGVDEYWHVGVDLLDVLGRLHVDLGV
jgi:methylmalonyl-CoA mutase